MEKNLFKLCESRSGPRSRIWLERDRLVAAGFTFGKTFAKSWRNGGLTLTLISKTDGLKRSEFGTVSGSKDRPVIDIVGSLVNTTFGKSEQYEATFTEGKIVIVPARKS